MSFKILYDIIYTVSYRGERNYVVTPCKLSIYKLEPSLVVADKIKAFAST